METMGKCILGQEDHSPRSSSGGSFSIEKYRMLDITRDKPIKVAVRVAVPVRDHPKFNFVGKLLGPKGNSLKRLQEDTMCKMAVLGRGSMKDRKKEEELRLTGDSRYSHLGEDLHVEISTFAPPAEAHARIAYALAEVRRFLVPDYHDDIRQEQMWEMQALTTTHNQNGDSSTPENGILSDTDSVDGGILNGYIPNNNNNNHNITNNILNGAVSAGLNCLNNNNNNNSQINNSNNNNNINNNNSNNNINNNSINHNHNNNNNNNNGHVNGNDNNLNTLNFVNNCDLNGNDMQIDLQIGPGNTNILGNNSNNSLTAAAAAAAAGGLLHNHPALHGIKAISIAAGGLGRKRPLFSLPRTGMNSTKRTVMTLLARAKNAQALHGSPRTTIIDPTTAVQLLTSPIILQQTSQLDQTNILQHNNNLSNVVHQVTPSTMTSISSSASIPSLVGTTNNGEGLSSQGGVGVISTLIS